MAAVSTQFRVEKVCELQYTRWVIDMKIIITK